MKRRNVPDTAETTAKSQKRSTSSGSRNVERAPYEMLPVFETPYPLVEIDREGKLKTCVGVLNQLKQIECPLYVIAITGPSRTGKSYLLNYLAGKRKGFPLGSTVYPETKGIWVWCQPHPEKLDAVLLLLDTEGLGDAMEGDEENVTWIFALSVLLSSTLVYNCKTGITQEGLSQLHYVTEMSKRIKKREESEDEDGRDFFTFFPNFVWVVRDFTLALKDRAGNPITSDQYLLNALQPREGNTPKIDASNKCRQCILEYFEDKKCFVFPPPVNGVSQLEKLESLSDSQLDSTFLQEVNGFCDYIKTQSYPKTAEGQPIQGKMFCHLLETYLQSIQSGNIPCVENAVKNMAEKENANAVEASFKVYEEQMIELLQKSLNTKDEFFKAHLECYGKAMKVFMSKAILDEEGKYQVQIKERIGHKFKEILKEWVQDHRESESANGNLETEKKEQQAALEELEKDFSTLQQILIREIENKSKEVERRFVQRQNELHAIHDNLSSQLGNTDEILNTLSEQEEYFNRDRENMEQNLTDIRNGGASFGKYLKRAARVSTRMIIGGLASYGLGLLSPFSAAAPFLGVIGAILGVFQELESTQNLDTQREELYSHQLIQKDERSGELKKELAGKTEAEPAEKEVLESGQVNYKEYERGDDVKKELQEKTEDPAWKMEIRDIFLGEFCKEKLEVFLSVKRTESVLTNLLQVILAKNNKEALCVIMVYISKKWKEDFSDNTISVWLGYDHRGEKTGEMVLVCFHSAVALSKFSQYLGFPMIYRRFDETEMEPLENRLQEIYRTVSFNKKDEEIIKRLINEHGEHLFKLHSNLEAITASSVKSTKNGIIKKTSILLYCRLKGVIPYSEEFFPKQLKVDDQDYLIDIREGFFSLGMNPAQRLPSIPHPHFENNPLRMGCSIGTSGFPFAGTLGPFVRFGANEIGFLTCAHVLGITNSISKTRVVQPSDIESDLPDDTRLCGMFEREKFDSLAKIGVDAALVCIDQEKRRIDRGKFVWMGSHQPHKIGMFEGNSPSFENGMVIGNPDLHNLDGMRDVCKFGRSTGLTQGLLVLENAMLKVHSATLALPDRMSLPPGCTHNTFIMKGQFLIQNVGNEPFFIPGDSGAGVYVVKRNPQEESKLALIGIAIGSLTSGECAMTPIGTVLEALGLNESNIITEGVMEIGP